jgi:hypothetical protein
MKHLKICTFEKKKIEKYTENAIFFVYVKLLNI